MRSDLDVFFRHDQRAIEQGEIADRTLAFIADGERTPSITGNVFADDDCARFFASELPKNLRALAIKAVAELHVRRDWFLPPIAIDASIFFNVAHVIANSVILSEAKNL